MPSLTRTNDSACTLTLDLDFSDIRTCPPADFPGIIVLGPRTESKSGATNFINRQRRVAGRFNWQEGFGAFSYSHSHLTTVIRYIQNQEQHHAYRTFQQECLPLLDKFQVPHDERYLFKPIDGES